MGFFGSSPEVGTFHSPYPAETVIGLIGEALAEWLPSGMAVSDPPVMDALYVSELSDRRIVISVGNAVDLQWAMIFDLEPSEPGTDGHFYYDRKHSQIISAKTWDLVRLSGVMVARIENVLRKSSATLAGKWNPS